MKLTQLLAFSPQICVASLRRLIDLSLIFEELQPHKIHQIIIYYSYYLLLYINSGIRIESQSNFLLFTIFTLKIFFFYYYYYKYFNQFSSCNFPRDPWGHQGHQDVGGVHVRSCIISLPVYTLGFSGICVIVCLREFSPAECNNFPCLDNNFNRLNLQAF